MGLAADLDQDGYDDLVMVSATAGTLHWIHNRSGQLVDGGGVMSTTAFGVTSTDAADIDGDGDLDVIVADGLNDTIEWYEFRKNEPFLRHLIADEMNGTSTVSAADMDRDGDLDLAIASYDDDRVVWFEQRSQPGGRESHGAK